MIKPQTLKGFRDFLPNEARKRQYVTDILKKVFESYGFEPIETPALEYEEILLGKYGEEGDKLMYRFEDRGKRKVALRYDQTVPLARVVAQYGSTGSPQSLAMPFKRYQIQEVFRADNTQKGRYREFLQCDADIVGSSSPLADVEILSVVNSALRKLGFKDFTVYINDRNIFTRTYFETSRLRHSGKPRSAGRIQNLSGQEVAAASDSGQARMTAIIFDKLKKIGRKGVIKELMKEIGLSERESISLFSLITNQKPTKYLQNLFAHIEKLGIKSSQYVFSPTLARGLDYYTSTIFEIEIEGYTAGSVCGGGRYDNLIGLFAGKDIPAVGFSFGFDRLMEAMDELNLFPNNILSSTTKVLVTVFSPQLLEKSMKLSSRLRANNIDAELYLDENAKIEKQLKYADKKGIPYAIIIGPDEASKNLVTLRNMKTREQEVLIQKDLVSKLV